MKVVRAIQYEVRLMIILRGSRWRNLLLRFLFWWRGFVVGLILGFSLSLWSCSFILFLNCVLLLPGIPTIIALWSIYGWCLWNLVCWICSCLGTRNCGGSSLLCLESSLTCHLSGDRNLLRRLGHNLWSSKLLCFWEILLRDIFGCHWLRRRRFIFWNLS